MSFDRGATADWPSGRKIGFCLARKRRIRSGVALLPGACSLEEVAGGFALSYLILSTARCAFSPPGSFGLKMSLPQARAESINLNSKDALGRVR